MKDKWCDLCAAKGLQKKLVYCHVNFEEAMLLCENSMCVYPFGSSEVASLLVSKRPTSHNSEKKRKRTKSSEVGNIDKMEQSCSKGIALLFYWSNSHSLCWLDAIMTILVNNRWLQLCLEKLQPKQSILHKLYAKFMQAQKFGPVEKGKKLLNEARVEVFEYLKSKIQCELGMNDSPLVSLSILLREDPQIKEKFMQEYKWNFKCTLCGYVQVNRYKKPIVTFLNTSHDFCMPSGFFVRPCYKCKSPGQRSTLEFQQFRCGEKRSTGNQPHRTKFIETRVDVWENKKLKWEHEPIRMTPCVSIHFTEGVCNEDFLTSCQFIFQGKEYELCQLVQYKRNPDHFVSWIRNMNGAQWAEVDDTKDKICEWSEGMPSVPLNEIHIAVWERTNLYKNNLVLPKVCETTSAKRRQVVPQQAVSSSNNKSVSLPWKTRKLKDPPLLRRTGAQVFHEDVEKLEENDKPNFDSEAFVENKEHFTENATCKRRNDVETFEPYIPRKKRSTVAGATTTNSNYTESCSGDFTKAKEEPLCSPDEDAEKSTNFLPWQDGISVQLGEKQKQAIACDNQSDSGYSSPGSNSSCASVTMPCAIEAVPNLDEFLGSLDSMDLLDLVNSERCDKTDAACKLTASKNVVGDVDIDDILGEIFSEEQFQNEQSVNKSDAIDDALQPLSLVTCEDLFHVLAAI